MKQSIISILLTVLMSMVGVNAFSYDIIVKNSEGINIFYNYINDDKELKVTSGTGYSGNVIIPEEVTYMNRTRKVTAIDEQAFENCFGLTSVTIPNGVTSIGNDAFSNCWELTSANIPNSVTSIGDRAFSCCSVLTSMTIPNSVTTIGASAFGGCMSLTSVNIPNSVTSINSYLFNNCSRLTSIIIPNSITTIGKGAFSGCISLTSITIPNSVTTIGEKAFNSCTCLTSVTIPNSVTTIGASAFSDCNSLTSVTIPKSVTSIGESAFENDVFDYIVSLIENPFDIKTNTFTKDVFKNVTLYVPVGTIDKYKATNGWKEFLFIVEGNGPKGGGDTPEKKKCATPTIGYQNGKLTFSCETDGVTCQYSITDSDIKSGSSNEVKLGVTYNISVYATKSGYDNSDTANATLCWIDVEPKKEGITGVASVRANAVLIQSIDGILSISGVGEGTPINIYNTAGQMVGSAKASAETTYIGTPLRNGEIGIVKIGEKAVKVLMK